MALGDELALKQIEVMLEMHGRKLQSELKAMREELAHTKDELHKAIRDANRSQESAAPQGYSGQFGASQAPPWAQAPQQAWSPQQGAPPQAPQWGAPPPQQQWQQAQPQAPPVNKWAPPPTKAPSTQPIDRNNVAPSEVTIDKFFNFSGGSRNK